MRLAFIGGRNSSVLGELFLKVHSNGEVQLELQCQVCDPFLCSQISVTPPLRWALVPFFIL